MQVGDNPTTNVKENLHYRNFQSFLIFLLEELVDFYKTFCLSLIIENALDTSV